MKLYGFQCNNCGAKSRDKPGAWLEVKTMHMSSTSEWVTLGGSMSEGRHYCSTVCLVDAFEHPAESGG